MLFLNASREIDRSLVSRKQPEELTLREPFCMPRADTGRKQLVNDKRH